MSMKHHAAAAVVVAAALAGSTLHGQGSRPAPRTPWGTPDLHGTWSFATVTPLERPQGVTSEFLTAAEIAGHRKAGDHRRDRRSAGDRCLARRGRCV